MFTDLFDFQSTSTKTCSKCKKELDICKFGNASGANYKRGECRDCAREIVRSRLLAKKIASKIPHDHKCPICERTEEEVKNRGGKKSGAWCCDHDHKTGKFRGWLCHDCNRAIGNLGDDANRLQRALEYLSRS